MQLKTEKALQEKESTSLLTFILHSGNDQAKGTGPFYKKNVEISLFYFPNEACPPKNSFPSIKMSPV